MAEQTQNPEPTHEIRNGPGKLDLAFALMKGAEVEFEIRIAAPGHQPVKVKAVIWMLEKEGVSFESWNIKGCAWTKNNFRFFFSGQYRTDSREGRMTLEKVVQTDLTLDRKARNRKQFKPEDVGPAEEGSCYMVPEDEPDGLGPMTGRR